MMTTTHGYYITEGEYFSAYDKTVFALDENEISGVIESTDGFYIVQRLPLEDDYINTNYEELKIKYQYSYINKLIYERRDELSFEFNEYGASLDLVNIK